MKRSMLLPTDWNVPEAFFEELGNRLGRQRAIVADGHLLLALHAPPDPEEPSRKGRFFWRKPDGTWMGTCPGEGIASLQNHLKDYATTVDRLDHQDDAATALEEQFEVIQALVPTLRSARHLHEALQEAVRLRKGDPVLTDLRDRAYEIERAAELAYQESRTKLEFMIAVQAEEHAESAYQMTVAAHRLNLLAAMFFPLATLAALFGMNVSFGFEASRSPLAFVLIVALGLICGIILTGFVLSPGRRRPSTAGKSAAGKKRTDHTRHLRDPGRR